MESYKQLKPLEEYDISPKTGFLPSTPPLRRLNNPYFEPWEEMMDDFNGLLLAGKLREKVHKMPMLDYKQLKTIEEYRRAFLILCMLSHSYVWGKHEPTSETLPANLAIPWTGIADHLGLCPVVCHAAVVLWNYRLLDSDGPIDLNNLATLATYSGSLDEAWFYLVTTAIESSGAPCLSQIVDIIHDIHNGSPAPTIRAKLTVIERSLAQMNDNLKRMYEKCDPYVFYWKIRPYLAGWENMAEAGLPLGLIYEGVIEHHESWSTDEYADMSHEAERLLNQYRRYAGGSAAQSSLIAALDVAFGVEHHRTGEKPPSFVLNVSDRYSRLPTTHPLDDLRKNDANKTTDLPSPATPYKRTNQNTFLRAMRKYMPRPHRAFLEDLEESANIRPYILQLEENGRNGNLASDERELVEAYNACLHQLKLFRDKHVQIVTLYIVNQARKGPNIPHGGFAIEKKTPDNVSEKRPHNALYPQTQLETAPAIRKDSKTDKVSQMFPQLGLARTLAADATVVRGTGGTNVMPFLKQSRDETNDMKVVLDQHQDETQKQQSSSWSSWFSRR